MNIELRWITSSRTTTQLPKLQYRVWLKDDEKSLWSKWKDIPLVVVPGSAVKR